jgi:RNA polymerase sigma-70 factor (ECF subfamily)
MLLGNLTNILDLPQTAARQDESAIVAELRAGSEEAFAWLIEQYGQPIYSLLARSVQDRTDAADITQEVFLKVFRGIQSFHGESSLKTWIYRIALHEASNGRRWWTRHKKCEITLETEACRYDSGEEPATLGEMLADAHGSPFEAAQAAEIKVRVEFALAQVTEPFRTAVVLRDIEGFSYEEMAEVLQVSLGTVKSRLVRGRTALKAALTETQSSASNSRESKFGLHGDVLGEGARG